MLPDNVTGLLSESDALQMCLSVAHVLFCLSQRFSENNINPA